MKTAYGLKHTARMFWNKVLEAMKELSFMISIYDPCVCWKWTKRGLSMWVSWIDDMLCIGHPEDVKESKKKFMKIFEYDDIGQFKEYVGCKIERTREAIKFTQLVLLESFKEHMKHQIQQEKYW